MLPAFMVSRVLGSTWQGVKVWGLGFSNSLGFRVYVD